MRINNSEITTIWKAQRKFRDNSHIKQRPIESVCIYSIRKPEVQEFENGQSSQSEEGRPRRIGSFEGPASVHEHPRQELRDQVRHFQDLHGERAEEDPGWRQVLGHPSGQAAQRRRVQPHQPGPPVHRQT